MKKLTVTVILVHCFCCNGIAQTCVTEQEIPSSTPDSRFIVDAVAETVVDKLTQLMWSHCSIGQSGTSCETGSASGVNWQNALTEAQNSTIGGYNDWRLPNVKELYTLVEMRCYSPSINTTIFPNTTNNNYWTSSPDVGVSGNAWTITSYGEAFRLDQSSLYNVRLVRNP